MKFRFDLSYIIDLIILIIGIVLISIFKLSVLYVFFIAWVIAFVNHILLDVIKFFQKPSGLNITVILFVRGALYIIPTLILMLLNRDNPDLVLITIILAATFGLMKLSILAKHFLSKQKDMQDGSPT